MATMSLLQTRTQVRNHGQVTPARHPFDANGDDGVLCNPHRRELRVTGAQQRLGVSMFCPSVQDFGTSAQHHPPQPCPVLIIAVCDDCDYGIFCNVSQALSEMPETRFGLSSMVM